MRGNLLITAVLVAAGSGCSLAPHYERPDTGQAPAEFKEAAGWKLAVPADAMPRGPWWTVFHDATLDELEMRVAGANQSLRAALARLEQAQAQTRIARAGLFPALSASATAVRARTSTNGPSYVAGKAAVNDDFVVSADVSYELDLFGRVRNTVAGARAGEQATAGDTAALDLSVHAELASDYFALRGLDAQQDLLDQTVVAYTKALDLTTNLYKGGAAAIADVQQATTQLATASTQAEDVRLRRAQMEHAIAVLVGETPSTFHVARVPLTAELAPPGIDLGMPSQLLERRPDVASAERRVAAANASVGVARAAFFPVFNLTAAMGLESVSAPNWLEAPSRFWAVGAQGLLSIFDAGLRSAQTDIAHAGYNEQVANYRSVVLTAYQEVEDNLAALRQLERESATQATAVAAAQGALEQANYRYKGGIATYLEVVSTENAALAARLAAVDIQTRRMTASVLLIKALGGDWQAAEAPAAAPSS